VVKYPKLDKIVGNADFNMPILSIEV
jgi:hypothetical protein